MIVGVTTLPQWNLLAEYSVARAAANTVSIEYNQEEYQQ